MSSNAFSTTLRADPSLRRFVLWSGGVLLIAGVTAIFVSPVSLISKLLVALPWSAMGAWEIFHLCGHWRTYAAIRVRFDGRTRVLDRDQEWHDAELLPGSILLGKYAWIRLRIVGGPVFAEPLRGTRRKCHDWRRLHVIWPHIGAPD